MKSTFLFFFVCNGLLYSQSLKCLDKYGYFESELKEYKYRINDILEKNELNCDILYAYNNFINNGDELNLIENDIDYMKRLSSFLKKYPYTGKFINTRKDFEFLDKYNIQSKFTIENVIKNSELSNTQDKKNIFYILMALRAQYNTINESEFKNDIYFLIRSYDLKDIKYIIPFWIAYYEAHKDYILVSHIRNLFDSFNKAVKTISIDILKNYYEWRNELFGFLLAEDYKNIKYTETIIRLLKESSMEDYYKIYFLKEISFEVNEAINNGFNEDEIVKYFKPFFENEKLMKIIYNESCNKSDDKLDIEVISGFLDAKLLFLREKSMIFNEIIKSLKNKSIEEQVITISYFNYMTSVYKRLGNNKDVLIKLYNELPFGKVKNMRAIMVLNEYSSYFDDLVNNNWKNKDYVYILVGVVRDDYRVSDSFEIKNWEEDDAKKFRNSIYSLIRTPHNELDDMTWKEIGNEVVDVADTASYATLLIPGVGVGITVARTLAKQSIKLGAKQLLKKGLLKRTEKNSWKFTKVTAKEHRENKIRYEDRRKKLVQNLNSNMEKANTTKSAGDWLYDYFYSDSEQKTICREN